MNGREDVAGKDIETLRQEMQQLRSDFAALTRTIKDIAGDVGSDAYARLRDRAGKARAQAEHAAETVGQSIEERPFVSMCVAFAVGLLMGLLFGRQR